MALEYEKLHMWLPFVASIMSHGLCWFQVFTLEAFPYGEDWKKTTLIFLSVIRKKGKQNYAIHSSKCPRNSIFVWRINYFMAKESICYRGLFTEENS